MNVFGLGTAANDAVSALQRAINRIAPVGQYATIAVDGGMGQETAQATVDALFAVGGGKCNGSKCFEEGTSPALINHIVDDDGVPNQTSIMQLVEAITTELNHAADSVGLSATPITVAKRTSAGSFLPTSVTNKLHVPSSASSMDILKALPTWQKVALGGGAFVALMLVAKKLKHLPKTKSKRA